MKAEYVDHFGSDLAVVNDARVSFAKASDWEIEEAEGDGWNKLVLSDKDTRLIQYLAKHGHWTPFAHQMVKLNMAAPVPIRTQCFKHKQGFIENEESRRYIESVPELYVPEHFRMKPEGSIKQGSGEVHPRSKLFKYTYKNICEDALLLYEYYIKEGVCPEQARFVLPQGCLVNWRWTGSLAAFARFYNQRTDPHAQKEIQELADAVGQIIEPLFPVSWKALTQ